jgi:hypothetical protein
MVARMSAAAWIKEVVSKLRPLERSAASEPALRQPNTSAAGIKARGRFRAISATAMAFHPSPPEKPW